MVIDRIIEISFSKKEGIMQKFPMSAGLYESVDDESLSQAISQNLIGKNV